MVSEPGSKLVRTRKMAMKEAEDKLETHDRDIFRLKELVFVMCKNVDQLMGEMREITLSRGKDRSLIMEGSHKKGFDTEVEEGESSQSKGGGDKGKYKWLEMPIFKWLEMPILRGTLL